MKQACGFIYLCKKNGNQDIGLCHVPSWWEEQEDGYLPGCPLTSTAMSMLQYSEFLKKLLTRQSARSRGLGLITSQAGVKILAWTSWKVTYHTSASGLVPPTLL